MLPVPELFYIVQLHAQTPKDGDPKITIRIPAKEVSDRTHAMRKAEDIAALRSNYDMNWIATSCRGPQIDRYAQKPKGRAW